MSDAGTIAVTVVGGALVLLALHDVFHTLFHPSGTGFLSRAIHRVLWRGARAVAGRRRGLLVATGPLLLVLTIALWAAALALGGALVLWPWLPSDFRFASGLASGAEGGLDTALYVSLVTLTTLGFGDVTPTAPGLRLLVALEAVVGFVLLTAGIAWIQSVYPVLSRRRTFAERLHGLERARAETGLRVPALEPTVAATLLAGLAAELATVHVDLVQTGITYYFTETHRRSALPALLPFALELADEGLARDDAPAVRHAAHLLHTAVATFAGTVRTAHLGIDERPLPAVLAAYAAAHRRGPGDDDGGG